MTVKRSAKIGDEAIWPAQIVAYVLGLAVVFFLVKKARWSDRFITGILAPFRYRK